MRSGDDVGARAPRGEGLALSLSSGVGSLAGLVTWLVAARLLPQAEVGRAAAFVSGFILIASASQLHIGVALLRWIPRSGRRAAAVAGRTMAVVGPLALVAAAVYALFALPLAATAARAVGSTLPVGIAVFACTSALWCLFVIQDHVLVGLGHAWWMAVRNIAFAVARVGLLVGLAGAGAGAVVLSWFGPLVVFGLVTGGVLAVLLARRARSGEPGAPPDRAEVVGFVGPTAVAHIGVSLLFNQVPLLVTLRWGDVPGAAFFVAWQAVIVVDTAAVFFTNALSAQVGREPGRADELCAAAGRRLLVIFLPALAVGVLIARPALGLFGPGYAEASVVLQVLLVGLAFRLVVLNELAALQATGRATSYAALQILSTLLVLAPVIALPVARGAVDDVLLPVAVGYLAVQVVAAVAVRVLHRAGARRLRRRAGPHRPAVAARGASG